MLHAKFSFIFHSFSLPPLFLSSSCTRELFYFATLFAILLELHSVCIECIKSMLHAYVIRKTWIAYLIATILLSSFIFLFFFFNDTISFELYETIAKNYERQTVEKNIKQIKRDAVLCQTLTERSL